MAYATRLFIFERGGERLYFDFSKLRLKERPVLILETLSGRKLQTLGYANEIRPHIAYNEVSTLEFTLPKMVDGILVPGYDDTVGWNIIEWKDLGRFILMDPQIQYSDGYEMKSCQGYSLEYEWVFKRFVLPEGVYNFWNPVSPNTSLLGMIMETVPQWTLGNVDSSLIGIYRSYDEESGNLYDFVKSTVQESVNCIFEFDTMTRTVHVRDVSSRVDNMPVYLSTKNLLKEVDIDEDSENIFTCLDVNGAEGVTIMGVNPTGTNKIYNLDYFMNSTHFPDAIISKWNGWKADCEQIRQYYYDMSIERDLQDSRWIVENAKLEALRKELEALESQQAAIISLATSNDYKNTQLSSLNQQISAKKAEITNQQSALADAEEDMLSLQEALEEINQDLDLTKVFTADEYDQVSRYFREDVIEETTFVYPTVKAYNTADEAYSLTNEVCSVGPENGMSSESPGITVTKVFHPYFDDRDLYTVKGGYVSVSNVSASLISGSAEIWDNGRFVASFYLGEGAIGDHSIKSGCLSLTGTYSNLTDNTTPDPDFPNAYATGTAFQFTITSGFIYITENLTSYQRHSVEWDLFEWGEDTLYKLASPTYTFSISSANFLSLEQFELFRKNLQVGAKCYIELSTGQTIQPILIGVECDYTDLEELNLEFSDSFTSNDSSFQMKDLLDKAISMGNRVDYSKNTYSSFVDSGASTSVEEFITSALDTSRNNIMTSGNQAISWDANGLRFRKWADDTHSEYEPEQIWAVNNQIVFSDDNFDSVKTAIGKIQVGDVWMYGIVAEAIIGRLLAGNNLVIESEKTDGQGQSVFKVDGEGVQIHDAVLDVFNGTNTHLSINPYFGIAIGKYPVFSVEDGGEYVVDEDKACFWVDLDGNLHIKGTLEVGSNGIFGGVVRATDFQDPNGNSMLVNNSSSSSSGGYQFSPDYLSLKGLTIHNNANQTTLSIDSNGNVSVSGNITMTGGSISWSDVGQPPGIQDALDAASDAQDKADDAYTLANGANSTANSASSAASSAEEAVIDLVNGRYTQSQGYDYSTFIRGNAIYSPNLYFGTNGNYGSIMPGYGSNGTSTTNLIVIHGDNGLRIEAEGGGLAIKANSDVWTQDTDWHMGMVYASNFVASGNVTATNRLIIGNNTSNYIQADGSGVGGITVACKLNIRNPSTWATHYDVFSILSDYGSRISALESRI